MMPPAFADAAFWVTLTFITVIVWLVLQGYWTRWAHRRVDELAKRVDKVEQDCAKTSGHINELEKRNPFAFMRRAN